MSAVHRWTIIMYCDYDGYIIPHLRGIMMMNCRMLIGLVVNWLSWSIGHSWVVLSAMSIEVAVALLP